MATFHFQSMHVNDSFHCLCLGAGGMLGGGCALELAKYGTRLALIDIDAVKLEAIVNNCLSAGLHHDRIVSVVGDVTKIEDTQKIVQEAVKSFGKITNLV